MHAIVSLIHKAIPLKSAAIMHEKDVGPHGMPASHWLVLSSAGGARAWQKASRTIDGGTAESGLQGFA